MSVFPLRPRLDVRGLALLLFAVVGWGSNWAPLKLLLQEVPPFTARAYAGLAAALFLAIMVRASGVSLRVPPGLWPRITLLALLNITAWMGLVSLALQWLDATEGVVITYTMPVWSALLAWPVLGERPTPMRLLAVACGLGGVVLIMSAKGINIGMEKLPGVLLCLSASICFALGTVLTKRRPLAMAPAAGVVWQVALGMLPLLFGALLFETPHMAEVSTQGWLIIGYMATLPLCLSYLAWFAALRRLPAHICTQGSLISPLMGLISANLMLGEPLGLRQLVAFGLILVGMVLAVKG